MTFSYPLSDLCINMPSSITESESSNSTTSSSSPKVTKTDPLLDVDDLWDEGQEWILIFDNLLKHPRGKAKGCHCDMCDFDKNEAEFRRRKSFRGFCHGKKFVVASKNCDHLVLLLQYTVVVAYSGLLGTSLKWP